MKIIKNLREVKKHLFLKTIITILLLFPFKLSASDLTNVWKNAHKSVVVVLPTWPGYAKPGFGAPSGTAPAGTGFYFSINNKDTISNYIITAAHVIEKSNTIEIKNHKSELEKVDLILIDKKRDIAILKTILPGVSIKVSKKRTEIGNDVCVIGNSFGLGASLSCGVISAKNRKNIGFNEIENFIQTDAAVNPGDSGAPLLNNKGQLIGMVDAIFTKEADIDAGVNFAIDNKLIYEFINMNLEIIK
tara:strand:- start:2904 stop:3641 length:738 start_codon:yes stop_codon:yes gene_type:complete